MSRYARPYARFIALVSVPGLSAHQAGALMLVVGAFAPPFEICWWQRSIGMMIAFCEVEPTKSRVQQFVRSVEHSGNCVPHCAWSVTCAFALRGATASTDIAARTSRLPSVADI